MFVGSPVGIVRTVPTVDPAVVAAEAADKRRLLQKRKIELEDYLKRLQSALAAERNATAALASAVDGNGECTPRASSAVRRKSSGASKKKGAVVQSAPPVADDGSMDVSKDLCIRFIDELIHNEYGYLFNAPVDWVALDIPTYPEIIKNPMDLGTIMTRLKSGHYTQLAAFLADVQLVWDNAKLFNAPKTFVHDVALRLEKIWHRKKDVLKKERKKALLHQQQQQQLAAAAREHAVDGPSAPQPKPSSGIVDKPLTFVEKSRLRADLYRVLPEHLESVIEITGTPVGDGSSVDKDLEIELDMESLSTATLRKLQQFVARVLPKAPGRVRSTSQPAVPLTSGQRRLSNSMTSVATAVTRHESDSDETSSSGLVSDSSDDEAEIPVIQPAALSSKSAPGSSTAVEQPSSSQSMQAPVVVNTEAWENLEDESAVGDGDGGEHNDPLWRDYQTMSAEARQKELQRQAEEERRRQEQECAAKELAAQAEQARRQREAEERQRKEEEAAREKERSRQLEEERAAARRELDREAESSNSDVEDQSDFLTGIFRA